MTTDRSPVGDLLRQWAAEGTAAGNIGDYYDNRDRGHSMLDLRPYPQIQLFKYSPEELEARHDWAVATEVRPFICFGNSSTSAGPTNGGCNPRVLTTVQAGFDILYRQYRGGNLYMYPAHHDYQPGHAGINGTLYGDLLPANTPYMIISHGSSGTDQPFMHAVPFTLAAFRPEVKKKLSDAGLLMPTLQMIFRMSNKQVKEPADYLTGKAHPVVFEGSNVNAEKMVRMAHDIDAGHVPPLARIELKESPKSVAGRDYVDPFPEVIGATPCAIATAFRPWQFTQRFVLSAKSSKDINNLPLTYQWVLLQGDAEKIKINPLNKEGSDVEIIIPYHERAPSVAIPEISSNRVDIAVFVNNGTYFSPPAIFSNFSFDSETRTYDDQQRIMEIGYSAGEPVISVNDWVRLLDQITGDKPSPALKLLLERAGISPANNDAIHQFEDRYKAEAANVTDLEKKQHEADDNLKKTPDDKHCQAEVNAARKTLDAGTKKRDELLTQSIPGLAKPIKELIESTLTTMMNEPMFYIDHASELDPAPTATLKTLEAYGIINRSADGKIELLPLFPGDKPAAERLSRYQKSWLGRLNGQAIAARIPGISSSFASNEADFRLTIAKPFRDVFRYATSGQCLGLTRYDGKKVTDFNSDGNIALERDAMGRCVNAQSVNYERHTPASYNPRNGPDPTPLTFAAGTDFIHYQYADANDFAGKATNVSKPDASATTQPK